MRAGPGSFSGISAAGACGSAAFSFASALVISEWDADLYSALSNRRHVWICHRTRLAGIFRTYERRPSDETSWTTFCIAAERAAASAGFPRKIAIQLVGAIGEM